ncbi:hypothetical protein CRYUN_Cryun07bG0141600 [Craigia yunnanensis]
MVFKLFFFFFVLELSIRSESCQTNCGYNSIIFPFQLRNQSDEYRCGYPGFDLSCNNQSQTIITLPSSGDFKIEILDYYGQFIALSDPADCLARRLILEGFDPSGTPFQPVDLKNFTLLNCSSDVLSLELIGMSIPCLNTENKYVLAIPVDRPDLFTSLSSCLKIAMVSLSMRGNWDYFSDLIWLTWTEPDCKKCVRNLGTCQYKKDTGLEVGCTVVMDQGSSTIAKYFMLFTALSFLCLFGLVICIPSMIKHYVHKRRHTNTEISGSTILQSPAARKGLDQRTIEMYPTMLLGESGELPKPNDTTCSICLLDYQAKDTLRTIPSCMHYFHANCIDEWLKRNATCPLCRE